MADEIAEKYVKLAEGIVSSDYALANLNKSLGLAQIKFTPSVKEEENKYGGYNYTPLIAIIKAVRPALAENHLTVMQFPVPDLNTKTLSLVTRLVHWDSAEWVQHTMEVPADLALGKDGASKFNQQTIGGSQTYAQKYAYKGILGIADSEEEIDGSDDKGNTQARGKAQSKPQPEVRPAPEKSKGVFEMLPNNTLHCVIRGITSKETAPKDLKQKPKPYLVVTFNGYIPAGQEQGAVNHAFCYDSGLFDAVNAGLDKEVKLYIDASGKFVKVNDVLSVAGIVYVNGKPSVDTSTGEIIEGEQG